MDQVLDDGEFWLPPKFLYDDDDDDVFIEKNVGNNGSETKTENEFCGSSDFCSPVESVTETESDEEDYLAGLTRQMAHSSLNHNVFGYDCAKGGYPSGSPQSTLSPRATACGCRGSSHNTSTHQKVRSRLDLLYAAAAASEVVRMHGNNADGYGALSQDNRFILTHTSQLRSLRQMQALHFQQQLRQQHMMMKQTKGRMMMMGGHMQQNQPQLVQNRGVGLSQTAWPTIQQAKQRQQSNRRAAFVGNPTGKRECAGTGVFLPRPVNTRTEIPPRKKPTVLIPAKVVHALNLNSDEMVGCQNHFQARFNGAKLLPFYDNDGRGGAGRVQGNNGGAHPVQMRTSWAHPPVVSEEARLPQEWIY